MAGGDYHPYKADPAIDRWEKMHSTMYQRFRMTTKNTRIVLILGVAVPVLTYYLADYHNDRWDLRGKLRGQSLLKNPPAPPSTEGED